MTITTMAMIMRIETAPTAMIAPLVLDVPARNHAVNEWIKSYKDNYYYRQ